MCFRGTLVCQLFVPLLFLKEKMSIKNIKLPVVSFIETSLQNKTFFNQKFIPKMVGNSKGRKPIQTRGFSESNETYQDRESDWYDEDCYILFDGWIGKERMNWVECKNDSGDKIEFYSKTYKINGVELPYPQTLDNFITDCNRLNINLWWRSDLIEQGLNIYHIVPYETCEEYINELLTIMDKL